MARMLENGVTESVADHVCAGRRRGTGCGGPKNARLLVANPNGFAVRIANGVVMPGCEPVQAAVARPRVAGAAFGDQESSLLVCDHVGPRHRRQSMEASTIGHDSNDVFILFGGKA